MSMRLRNKDYIKIVKHYNYPIPLTREKKPNIRKTRKLARDILANKLCKCIKSVQKNYKNNKKYNKKFNEANAIAICNRSIFTKRNLIHHRFTCKKKNSLLNKRHTNYALSKKKKELNFGKRNKRSKIKK